MRQIETIKKGIWVYFILLIIEGGLRRWVVPGLASPLLLLRDVVGIYLLILAYNNNFYPSNIQVKIFFVLGIISIYTALFFGHGNLFVALYGARMIMIQLPLLYLIGKVFNQHDVIAVGKVILWLAVPMAILITLQFYSPQSAWVNKGVGNSVEGAGFSGANGYFRPPGTFSFISGVSSFFSLVGCFVFYFWIKPHLVNKNLLIAASAALLVAIPTSISRTLFFQVALTLLFFIYAKSSQPDFLKNMLQIFFGFILVGILFSNLKGFEDQIGAFTERFNSANENENGIQSTLLDHALGGLIDAFSNVNDQFIIFGQGIGMGTNVGAQVLAGKLIFLISEGEWGRIIGESGFIIGLVIILLRSQMSFKLLFECLNRFKNGNVLPFMLLSYGFIVLLQGQWSQPTNLGFYVLIGGLIMASLKKRKVRLLKKVSTI